MKVFAPGKLVLAGAYAVLEGAPAIAVAVSRGATADGARVATSPTPEVRAAFGDAPCPHVDATAMFSDARKLGLGASAAILVASLGVSEAARGTDLADPRTRERIFTKAFEAHRAAQSGGSGVDIAASVHGGAIRYVMGEVPRRVTLPSGLAVTAFACATSASTSELRAKVDGLARSDAAVHRACMDDLAAIAHEAARAVDGGDAAGFVGALRRTGRSLDRLGIAADVGIVPAGFEGLEAAAALEDASFTVAGAGGGDVAVFVGPSAPSTFFVKRAMALGLVSLTLSVDQKGVRTTPDAAAFAVSGVS